MRFTWNGSHFKAHFNRGFAYDKLRQFELAVADYSTAIRLDPTNAFAYYNRGISLDRSCFLVFFAFVVSRTV